MDQESNFLQNMLRYREQQANRFMPQQPMMPGQMPLNMRRNGVVPPNLQRAVLQNNTPALFVPFVYQSDSLAHGL